MKLNESKSGEMTLGRKWVVKRLGINDTEKDQIVQIYFVLKVIHVNLSTYKRLIFENNL